MHPASSSLLQRVKLTCHVKAKDYAYLTIKAWRKFRVSQEKATSLMLMLPLFVKHDETCLKIDRRSWKTEAGVSVGQ